MGDLNPNNDGEKAQPNLNRRGFIHGLIGLAGIASLGSTDLVAGAPSTVVNLGNEGLSPGDDITPYLEEFWNPGTHVIIPGGRYSFSGDGDALSIDADEDSWLVGDGLVVFDTGYDFLPITANGDAHVRYENLEWDDELDARIRTWTTSTSSTIELVNVNIHGQPGTDEAGIYGAGDGENIGTLRFVNCTVENFDDGLYMSSMFEGAPEDGQAVVEVYGGLYRNCTSANIRVGGHNSKVISATSVCQDIPSGISNTKPLKIREAGENQIVRDCDFYVSDEGAVGDMIIVTSDKFEGDRDTSVLIEDTRMYSDQDDDYINVGGSAQIEGRNLHLTGSLSSSDTSETLEGSGPYSDIVTGSDAQLPTVEKRFVDPATLDPVGQQPPSTSPSEDQEDEESEEAPSDHTFEIRTFEDSGIIYEFTVAGTVAAGDSAELDNNDFLSVTNGLTTVEGETGHGYIDDFIFDGELVNWQAETHPDDDSGEYELVLDGAVVSPDQITDSEPNTPNESEEEPDNSGDNPSDENTNPTINRYEVRELGSLNSHADIVVEWDVSDEDGDLHSVVVRVTNSSGITVDATQTNVGGETAYGVNFFKIRDVDGQSFDVETVVTDEQGNSDSASATVTE